MKTILLSILLFTSITFAQPANASFRNLTSADGLPSTTVTDVAQDAFGFIWIASWDGDYRYDGRIFKKISGTTDGRYLTSDKKGGVWISFHNSVGYYDPYADSVKMYDIPQSYYFPLIRIDDSGKIWVATTDGLLRFDSKINQFKRDPGQKPGFVDELNAWGDGKLLFLYRDNNGTSSIGTRNSNGKYFYEPFPVDLNNPEKENPFIYRDEQNVNLTGQPVFVRRMDSTGILIINKLGWAYRNDNKANWIFKKPLNSNLSLAASDAKLDFNGNLWLNQVDAISRINITTGKTVVYKYEPGNPNSILPLNSDFFGSNMFIDRQGVLWVTSFSKGISRLNLFESDFGLLKDSTGSPILDVLSALELKGSSYWIGIRTANNGLIHYSADGKIIKRYGSKSFDSPPGRTVSTELSHPFAWTIAQSNGGSIWVGTGSPGPNRGGLNRIRPGSNLITRYKYNSNDTSFLSENWIGQILVDGSDRVWTFSFDGKGICFIDPATEKITHRIKSQYSDTTDNSPYLPELVTSSGDIIIETPDYSKAYIIDHTTLEKKPFGIQLTAADRLQYIHQDDAAKIWFVSKKGFGYLDSTFIKIEYFYSFEKNGFPANEIVSLNSDKKGNIWLATDNGLDEFNPLTKRLRHFGFERGLQGNYFSSTLNYRGPSGKIYFGGNGGINIFDPGTIKTNPYPPEMIFTGLKLDGRSIKFGEKSAIQKPIFAADKITVGPDVLTITIDFAAIHFAGYESNRYQYKLEGFDKDWRDGGNIGNATYTNLSPGKYTLYIKGSNWDGVWSDGEKSIAIIVMPPWWQTWWAYTLYIILGITLLYCIRKFELNRKFKNARIRESQLQLEASEAKAKIIEAENARKTEELEEARQLQLSMLPKQLPQIPNLDIAVFMQTASEVGGDYYDFRVSLDGTLNVALGDATGHGLQAGTLVTIMKGIFTIEADNNEVLPFFRKSVQAIKEIKLGRLMMAFAFLKIKGNQLSLSNAGVPPVYIYKNDKKEVEEIDNKGMPLGAMSNFPYKETKAELNKGDVIFLLSDGFPELSNDNKEVFGYERVKSTFKEIGRNSAEKIIEHLKNTAKEWSGGKVPDDDVTFVVIKIK